MIASPLPAKKSKVYMTSKVGGFDGTLTIFGDFFPWKLGSDTLYMIITINIKRCRRMA
jgi:hypothetical protein